MKNNRALALVETGLFAACITFSILYIRIPMPINFVHPGNALVVLSALLLGAKRGTVASVIGLMTADILLGYVSGIPFILAENILVIAVVLGFKRLWQGKDTLAHVIGYGVMGALTKVVAVPLRHILMQLAVGTTLEAAVGVALGKMPATLITAVVTASLVVILYRPLKRILQR